MDGFEYTGIVQSNGLPLKRDNPDDSLIVEFSTVAVKNEAKTTAAGYPQFDDVEMIKITVPGDRDPLFEGEVREKDKTRFAARYARWKESKIPSNAGFPIEEWPVLCASQIAELKSRNIFTVENICDVPDSKIFALGLHGRKLRDQAKDFILKARGEAPMLQIRAENEKLSERIAALEAQNAQLLSHLKSVAQHDPNIEITAPTLPQPTANITPQVDLAAMVAQAVAAALAANQPQVAPKKKGGRPKKVITETSSEESN